MFKLKNSKNEVKEIVESSDTVSGNGYVKYPDGTLIQHGTYQAKFENSASGNTNVEFAIPFIDSSYFATSATLGGNSELLFTFGINPISNKSCNFVYTNKTAISMSRGCSYLAIGRWK